MGIIVACGPAIRQFVAYVKRTGTALPSIDRQRPQEDFSKMRRRITIRDILWFRSPGLVTNRVLDAHPTVQFKTEADVESTAQKSLLNEWPRKLGDKLFRSNASKSHKTSDATSEISLSRSTLQNEHETTVPNQEKTEKGRSYEDPELISEHHAISNPGVVQAALLGHDSMAGRPDQDYELADTLTNPTQAHEDRAWRSARLARDRSAVSNQY